MREVFEPTVRMIPAEYRSQIEPAQFFHEVLTHRWFLAEQAGHDVPMVEAVGELHRPVCCRSTSWMPR